METLRVILTPDVRDLNWQKMPHGNSGSQFNCDLMGLKFDPKMSAICMAKNALQQ